MRLFVLILLALAVTLSIAGHHGGKKRKAKKCKKDLRKLMKCFKKGWVTDNEDYSCKNNSKKRPMKGKPASKCKAVLSNHIKNNCNHLCEDEPAPVSRIILEPPKTTNVAKGGEAKLTCKASGDAVATITFHKSSDDSAVGTVAPSQETKDGVVTTTGVLTISNAMHSDSLNYYCKAIWPGTGVEAKSAGVFLGVLDITRIKSPVWGVVGRHAKFECESDAVLLKNVYKEAVLDENDMAMVATAQVTWQYYDTSSESWKESTEDPRFQVPPTIQNQVSRTSFLQLSGLTENDNGLRVRCNVAYQTDPECNYYGGTVTSGKMELKVACITSFTASTTSPLIGETLTLTCVATGDSAPDFKFSYQDPSYFKEVKAVEVTSVGNIHTAKLVTSAVAVTVMKGGVRIKCEADYGLGSGKTQKDLTVTTYYDCASVEVKSLNDLNPEKNEASIVQTDGGDGTITQTITCPADTDTARFQLVTTWNSAASITCTKTTGQYVPKFLAACQERESFTWGRDGVQVTVGDSPQMPCDDGTLGEYSPENMKAKLLSTTDANCGFRHVVPCIKSNQCTFDKEQSGCLVKGKIVLMWYTVNLNSPVWSMAERDALVKMPEGAPVKFFGCQETYNDRERRAEE